MGEAAIKTRALLLKEALPALSQGGVDAVQSATAGSRHFFTSVATLSSAAKAAFGSAEGLMVAAKARTNAALTLLTKSSLGQNTPPFTSFVWATAAGFQAFNQGSLSLPELSFEANLCGPKTAPLSFAEVLRLTWLSAGAY